MTAGSRRQEKKTAARAAAAAGRSVLESTREPDFHSLRSALAEAGATLGALDVGHFDGAGGRGLQAVEEAAAGEELLRVPLRCCLHNRVELSPEPLQAVLRWASEESRWPDGEVVSLALCLRIWFELHTPSSPTFEAYMPFLVTGCDVGNFPHRWSAAQVDACGPMSSMTVRRQELVELMKRLKKQLLETMAAFPDVFPVVPNDKEVEWLHCCCTSRARTLDGVHVMAPVGDLANHASDGALLDATLGEAGEVVTFRLTEAVAAGSQVLCSYRKNTTNEELAINFAFVIPGNPFTTVSLKLQLSGAGAEVKVQMLEELDLARFLQDDGEGRRSVVAMLRPADAFPNALVAISRVLVAGGRLAREELLQQVSPGSAELDRKWMPVLQGVLQQHLRRYPPRQECHEPWDVIYNDTRAVLKNAMERLLHLQMQLNAE
eukprot:CAMPEP_0117545670 /NCGR_PEP_ID=MMETSP0784-20121206/46216_1 /TAXON_ID=39447 /ORGANISM="" /LENGTH=433 /DNA_ID=CAMNT_0005342527 /DNA_START=48 /DNA_END=1349 /DNA_ORIENTATION=-